MGDEIFPPSGQFPSRTEDPRLQWGLNPANFRLPPIDSLGIGNTPPSLFYGPGAVNFDWSIAKEFSLSSEARRTLEIRAEAFNTFNHFNPNNPNSPLTCNFNTGAQNNAAFGAIQGAQVQARRMILPARIRF